MENLYNVILFFFTKILMMLLVCFGQISIATEVMIMKKVDIKLFGITKNVSLCSFTLSKEIFNWRWTIALKMSAILTSSLKHVLEINRRISVDEKIRFSLKN
jgi:hypothetical protein